jgi:hypothetical protein
MKKIKKFYQVQPSGFCPAHKVVDDFVVFTNCSCYWENFKTKKEAMNYARKFVKLAQELKKEEQILENEKLSVLVSEVEGEDLEDTSNVDYIKDVYFFEIQK